MPPIEGKTALYRAGIWWELLTCLVKKGNLIYKSVHFGGSMANKGEKSCYVFECVADLREISRILNDFLYANNFKYQEKNRLKYFINSDPIAGKRFFEYYFNGNILYIYVYINNTKKPWPLDDKYFASVPKQAYRNILEPLINELNRVNENARYHAQYQGCYQNGQYHNTGYANMQYNNINNIPYTQNQSVMQNGYAGTYQNKFSDINNKSKENQAVWGFVFSGVGVIMSLFGYSWGIFILFIEIYFAIQGFNTKKKLFSIMTFILAALSIILFFLYITGTYSIYN